MKLPYFLVVCCVVFSCRTSYEEPIIPLNDYQIAEGFSLEMVASEPLLTAPVAIDFDTKGRIWTVEMKGYMTDLNGTGESDPSGSIKILEDLDHDGVMDHAKVFLDSLVMPRALALVYGGLLYAEPPNLWFVEIENDKPKNRVLVDSLYAARGNPEHQPNGLLLNIDNWIYNAKSHFRYRRIQGEWHKEPTSFRGQWGITHDNFGRLYYNDNSRQLLGDYLLPNLLIRNKFYAPEVAVNQMLTKDQRVYPLHPTAVNRGYAVGVLNKDSLLLEVTAACGPLVYRGGLLGSDYHQNAFVCVPEANLIKRNIVTFQGDRVAAEQAWQGKEFLASLDKGFRPVNLSNGPDGAMYIVDMHRGSIAHHAYMSPYLKKKYKEEGIDTIIDYGRILKVVPKNTPTNAFPNFNDLSINQWVGLLKDDNGWIRDQAQHQIIFRNMKEAIPSLTEIVREDSHPLASLHALYALEGLDALSFSTVMAASGSVHPDIVAHALVLLENFVDQDHVAEVGALFQKIGADGHVQTDLYLSSILGSWIGVSESEFLPLLTQIFQKHKDNSVFQEAILSGISGASQDVLAYLEKTEQDSITGVFRKTLLASVENEEHNTPNPVFTQNSLNEDDRTSGATLFRQICAACHGFEGQGIEGMAPPLMKSDYMSSRTERIALIILHGLKGPVHVKGKRYDFNQVMPGLLNNDSLSDEDISDIISYVTNAFSDTPKKLRPEKIKKLRGVIPHSGVEYTEGELEEVLTPSFLEDL